MKKFVEFVSDEETTAIKKLLRRYQNGFLVTTTMILPLRKWSLDLMVNI